MDSCFLHIERLDFNDLMLLTLLLSEALPTCHCSTAGIRNKLKPCCGQLAKGWFVTGHLQHHMHRAAFLSPTSKWKHKVFPSSSVEVLLKRYKRCSSSSSCTVCTWQNASLQNAKTAHPVPCSAILTVQQHGGCMLTAICMANSRPCKSPCRIWESLLSASQHVVVQPLQSVL